jgi:hypothetical protein
MQSVKMMWPPKSDGWSKCPGAAANNNLPVPEGATKEMVLLGERIYVAKWVEQAAPAATVKTARAPL